MKLIVLSRDGVINKASDNFIRTPDEWDPIPGSLQAIGRLCQAGYRVVIATNQSGISRGLYDVETLHAMHAKMDHMLEQYGGRVESIFYCPHGPRDNCQCRKPKDGMFRDIMSRYQRDLTGVPVVGDSLRDVQAAQLAGASPILVKTGNGQKTLTETNELNGVPVFEDLAAVADNILAESDL